MVDRKLIDAVVEILDKTFEHVSSELHDTSTRLGGYCNSLCVPSAQDIGDDADEAQVVLDKILKDPGVEYRLSLIAATVLECLSIAQRDRG